MKSFRPFLMILAGMSVGFGSACTNEAKEPQEVVEAPAAIPAEKALPNTIPEALSSEFRTPSNEERDVYRHPLETLQFFGLEPNMRVLEISPGAGWYSEILAPLLTRNGEFLAAVPAGTSDYAKQSEAAYREWIKKNPEIKATVVPFELGAPLNVGEPLDMILTFRNVHNWMNQNKAQAAFNSFFAALKPGAVLGVVEHRGDEKKKQDPKGKSGYVKESEVIAWATKAGFKLESKSEVNANPKDTKDYPEGVWTLPPTFARGDVDREKYKEIGESDRMTLKFVKPLPGDTGSKAKGKKK